MNTSESFKAYLIKKKIDADQFKEKDPTLYAEWEALFNLMHPNSFTSQKLYLINRIRLKYLLKST